MCFDFLYTYCRCAEAFAQHCHHVFRLHWGRAKRLRRALSCRSLPAVKAARAPAIWIVDVLCAQPLAPGLPLSAKPIRQHSRCVCLCRVFCLCRGFLAHAASHPVTCACTWQMLMRMWTHKHMTWAYTHLARALALGMHIHDKHMPYMAGDALRKERDVNMSSDRQQHSCTTHPPTPTPTPTPTHTHTHTHRAGRTWRTLQRAKT